MTNEWQPIETAPKNKAGSVTGPPIRVRTMHHGHEFIITAQYCAGQHNRWIDTDKQSSVSAVEGDGSEWMPLPDPPERVRDKGDR